MGLSLEQTIAMQARPRHWDALETYEAGDGRVLYLVTFRKKGCAYYLNRYTYKALNYLLDVMFRVGLLREQVLIKNPLPFEFAGLLDSEREVRKCVRWLRQEAKRRGVGIGINVGPLTVNRCFPFDAVRWGGLTDPQAWLGKSKEGGPAPLRLVADSEWSALNAELNEWRAGRLESDTLAGLRQALRESSSLWDWRRDIECRVCRLEQAKGGPCGDIPGIGAARPH